MGHLLAWLASMTTRRTVRADEPDLADMGTAFGLDASMASETDPPSRHPTQAPRSQHELVPTGKPIKRPFSR